MYEKTSGKTVPQDMPKHDSGGIISNLDNWEVLSVFERFQINLSYRSQEFLIKLITWAFRRIVRVHRPRLANVDH